MVKVKTGQSFIDIAIQETGNVENAFLIALSNNSSITDDLLTEESLTVPEGLPVVKKDNFVFKVENVKISKIKVLTLQTFFDLSMQYTGTSEHAFSIALANKKCITDTLLPGEVLILPLEINKSEREIQYYKSRAIIPATGFKIKKILEYMFPAEFPISF